MESKKRLGRRSNLTFLQTLFGPKESGGGRGRGAHDAGREGGGR